MFLKDFFPLRRCFGYTVLKKIKRLDFKKLNAACFCRRCGERGGREVKKERRRGREGERFHYKMSHSYLVVVIVSLKLCGWDVSEIYKMQIVFENYRACILFN